MGEEPAGAAASKDNFSDDLDVLIMKASKGDQHSFRKIYDLHAGKMYSLCKRFANSNIEADDLFQEGFIKLYRNLSNYRGDGSFEGWVRRVFVTTCLDILKKKNNLHLPGHFDNEADASLAIEPEIINKLDKEQLIETLQKLPPGYRTIINLFSIEGYSHKEIAELLGISEGTSKSQYSKARKKLKELIINSADYGSNA
ncbi:MAG: sigma-70 family RNA polymerase sigma factor [Ferruginibacter sp.]